MLVWAQDSQLWRRDPNPLLRHAGDDLWPMGPRDSPLAPGASPGFPLSSRPVFRWDTRALHLETPRLFLQNLRLAWTCSPQRQRCVVSKTRHPGRKIEVLGNRDLVENSKTALNRSVLTVTKRFTRDLFLKQNSSAVETGGVSSGGLGGHRGLTLSCCSWYHDSLRFYAPEM